MSDSGRAILLARWWEHQRLSDGDRQERKALEQGESQAAVEAYQIVCDLVEAGDPSVIQLLADLVDAGPPDIAAAFVGAGPLEDLLHEHGDRLIDDLEDRARRSPSFHNALAAVLIEEGQLGDATFERLRAITSTQD